MSEIIKDISKVWDRIFEQKGFLCGEINFVLQEFEVKEGDSDIDNLFKSIEHITDIKDTQINRLSELVNEHVVDANQQLREALKLCGQFIDLEEKFAQSTAIEEARDKRKDQWEKVMNEITSEYSRVNTEFEEKEIKTAEMYKDLEKKLK